MAHIKTSVGNMSMPIGNMSIDDHVTQDGHTRTTARVMDARTHKSNISHYIFNKI